MKANKKILVLTDFSENAMAAEEYAVQLATQLRTDIIFYNTYAMHVTPIADTVLWPHDDFPSLELQSISNLQASVDEWNEKIKNIPENNYKPSLSHLGDAGPLEDNLSRVVVENRIWFVVMGTKGEGKALNTFFGSNVFNVLEKVDCPVLIVPQDAHFNDLKKIAYATDLLTTDIDIVEWIKHFSDNLKTRLLIVSIFQDDISPEIKEKREFHEKILQKLSHVEIQYLYGRKIKNALRKIAEDMNVDILALMHRKYGFFETLFHASTSHNMVRHTQIPIIVFPG